VTAALCKEVLFNSRCLHRGNRCIRDHVSQILGRAITTKLYREMGIALYSITLTCTERRATVEGDVRGVALRRGDAV
jgi:hypothetical protein